MKTKNIYVSRMFTMIVLTSFCILFTNCESALGSIENDTAINKEENSLKTLSTLEYLDVDVSNPLKATEDQKAIIEKAKTRIDSYIMYDKNLKIYRFNKIEKGEEIQMSERLFEFFKTQMDKSNEMLNELKNSKDFKVLQDIKDSKRLHIIKNK